MKNINYKSYTVTIRETLERTVIVSASSIAKALQAAEEMYAEEEVVLDADDHTDTEFFLA